MNRRFLQWHEHVFSKHGELLVITGFNAIATPSAAGPRIERRAALALAGLARVDGVQVAILGKRSASDLALRCCDIPRAWIVADDGDTLRDARGNIVRLRRPKGVKGSRVHAVRTVLARMPRATAALLGADSVAHVAAVTAVQARRWSMSLHVAGSSDAQPVDIVDGVVHGREAWIEFLCRLHGLVRAREITIPKAAETMRASSPC